MLGLRALRSLHVSGRIWQPAQVPSYSGGCARQVALPEGRGEILPALPRTRYPQVQGQHLISFLAGSSEPTCSTACAGTHREPWDFRGNLPPCKSRCSQAPVGIENTTFCIGSSSSVLFDLNQFVWHTAPMKKTSPQTQEQPHTIIYHLCFLFRAYFINKSSYST